MCAQPVILSQAIGGFNLVIYTNLHFVPIKPLKHTGIKRIFRFFFYFN